MRTMLLIPTFLLFADCVKLDAQQDPPTHNRQIFARLSDELKADTSHHRKAILKGLQWCLRFTDEDDYLFAIFSDYVQMLYELTLNPHDPAVNKIARAAARNSFERAAQNLESIFRNTPYGKWDFISVIPFLYYFEIDTEPFRNFYNSYFSKTFDRTDSISFSKALETRNYDLLSDILIDYYFVHFLYTDYPRQTFDLPPDKFPLLLARTDSLSYRHTISSLAGDFHDQNYYLTHIVYMVSNYGKDSVDNNRLIAWIRQYLITQFEVVRHQVGDIDLLSEFVHCLKILHIRSGAMEEAIGYLISRQNADGSWATLLDLSGDAYDQFHPTWAVMTALYYP